MSQQEGLVEKTLTTKSGDLSSIPIVKGKNQLLQAVI